MTKTIAALVTAALIGLAAVSTAAAQPNKATATLDNNTPPAGTTLYVTFTVFGTAPVVPYAYALQNTCTYPPKLFGHFTLGQHDDIATWTDQGPGGEPRVTMPVYLQSVPAGSSCRVSLVLNNTVVKGSAVSYTVA